MDIGQMVLSGLRGLTISPPAPEPMQEEMTSSRTEEVLMRSMDIDHPELGKVRIPSFRLQRPVSRVQSPKVSGVFRLPPVRPN